VPEVAKVAGHGHQVGERISLRGEQRFDFVEGERLAGARPGQGATEPMGDDHVGRNVRPVIPPRKQSHGRNHSTVPPVRGMMEP
jgi:hypothetical protein